MMAGLEIAMSVEYSLEHANVVDMKDVHAERIAIELVGVNVTAVKKTATVNARCGRGHGKLYKDWYDEWVCPICGYHKYGD
tara:strand:- start:545 stop:787 length:243 start_codon:yes stop_codon:yes gene_type:complete